MQKSYFYNYFKQLGKQDQKRFLNVLDLYPKDIKPRFYSNVQNQIENNKKIAGSTKEKMLEFNDYIFEEMFSSNEFIKEYQGFKIGDEVFVDDDENKHFILEFVVEKDGILVIFTDDDIHSSPKMIEMISKKKDQIPMVNPIFIN